MQSFDLYDTHEGLRHQPDQRDRRRAQRRGVLVCGGRPSRQPAARLHGGQSTGRGGTGAITALNKLRQPADLLAAAGLLHTRQTSILARLGYDLTPMWQLTQLVGFWSNDESSFLTDASGHPTYAGAASFASNNYALLENHLMTAPSLKSDSHAGWDVEGILSFYDYLQDRQVSPAGVSTGTGFTRAGLLADYGGTQWGTLDLKGIWRPAISHELSLGVHVERASGLWQANGCRPPRDHQ